MNPKSSKIYGKATCRRFWLVKAHHYRFSLRLFKRPSCSQCISSALVGYGTPDPQIVKKQHAQNREIQLVTNQDLPRKGQATESLGPSTGGWKYLSSNLKNTNYWINLPHWMTQVVLSFPTHSWKIKLLQSHTWGPPVTSIYYLLVLYGFVTSPYCQNTPRGCVLVCFGAFSKRKASAMKQPQLRSRPRDADCLVARMVALDQGQCFGPGTLHLRWQSQWTKMLRCGCGGWETLIDLNLSSNLWNNLSINLSSYIHIARIKSNSFYLPPTTRDPRMNRFNTEPWFQGGYLREGKGFYDRLPEMAASEIIFHMPRKFPIPTARLITYFPPFTPKNHRHWIYNSPGLLIVIWVHHHSLVFL